MDRGKILLYHPQLFLREDEILILPSKDFHKWHGDVKEYIDGLYQINSQSIDKSLEELNLALGLIVNIVEELEHLFDEEIVTDSYQYVSAIDENLKKRRNNFYSSDMRRCDLRIPVKPEITPALKNHNMMELVEYANWKFSLSRKEFGKFRLKENKDR
jgi:hypothetical protein